jgi:tetratricopeptide (TPR) repeat protein
VEPHEAREDRRTDEEAAAPASPLEIARAAIDDGRYGEAKEICERVLEDDSDLAEAHTVLGLALHGLDREEEARRAFLQAIELGGSDEPANLLVQSLFLDAAVTEPVKQTIAYVEYQPAVDQKSASFGQVFAALYGAMLPASPLEAAHALYYYPELSRAFQRAHGRVTDRFFANEFAAGAALTSDGRLHVLIWWNGFYYDTRSARARLRRITDLRDEAEAYLRGARRKVFLEKLYTAATELIVSIHAERPRHNHPDVPAILDPPTDQHAAELDELEERLGALAEDLKPSARHQAQLRYSVGTVLGAAALAAVALTCTMLGVSGVGLGVTLAGAAGSFVNRPGFVGGCGY